jgi:hypothetical protein
MLEATVEDRLGGRTGPKLLPGSLDVVRPANAGPHAEELAAARDYLDALVRSIGHVELAVRVDREAVRRGNWLSALAGVPNDLTRKRQQLAPLCGASR